MKYFWLFLTIFAVLWYSIVTAYVAFKGVADIRDMLNRLRGRTEDQAIPTEKS